MTTLQNINLGNQVNDGLGDDLRTAFQKVNANFASLNSTLTITASNVGGTGFGVFKQKNIADLEFKNLVPGTKIFIEDRDTSLVINSTAPDSFTRIDTNAGSVTANSDNLGRITVQGTRNTEVTATGPVITVDTRLPVTDILTTYDFGPLTGDYQNAMQLALTTANIDFGTFETPGRLDLDGGRLAP